MIFNKYFSNGSYKEQVECTEEDAWYNRDGSIGTALDDDWQ